MSTEHTRGTDKKATHDRETSITVTAHARLRYLQRVDPGCPNPKQKIRELFESGSPAQAHPDVDHGRGQRAGDVVMVYHGSEAAPKIVTILQDANSGSGAGRR